MYGRAGSGWPPCSAALSIPDSSSLRCLLIWGVNGSNYSKGNQERLKIKHTWARHSGTYFNSPTANGETYTFKISHTPLWSFSWNMMWFPLVSGFFPFPSQGNGSLGLGTNSESEFMQKEKNKENHLLLALHGLWGLTLGINLPAGLGNFLLNSLLSLNLIFQHHTL